MLTLERHVNESIMLKHRTTGEEIVVMLMETRQGKAKIGVHADKCWLITRSEFHTNVPEMRHGKEDGNG